MKSRTSGNRLNWLMPDIDFTNVSSDAIIKEVKSYVSNSSLKGFYEIKQSLLLHFVHTIPFYEQFALVRG